MQKSKTDIQNGIITSLQTVNSCINKQIIDHYEMEDFLIACNNMLQKFTYNTPQQFIDDAIALLSVVSTRSFYKKDFYKTHMRVLLNICNTLYDSKKQDITFDDNDDNDDMSYIIMAGYDVDIYLDMIKNKLINQLNPPIFPSEMTSRNDSHLESMIVDVLDQHI